MVVLEAAHCPAGGRRTLANLMPTKCSASIGTWNDEDAAYETVSQKVEFSVKVGETTHVKLTKR